MRRTVGGGLLSVGTTFAKAGRNQLRELMIRDPQKFKDLEPVEEMVRKKAVGGEAGGGMTAADLASLVLADPGEDDEDLENDEDQGEEEQVEEEEGGLAA